MPRNGNPDNLRHAARRKHEEALERAEQAVNALVRNGEAVNFRAVARLAGCSPDFLYRTSSLRARIEQLRKTPRRSRGTQPDLTSSSAVMRALSAQLADEKRRHRDEVARLQAALAAAHGELLELRRNPPPAHRLGSSLSQGRGHNAAR